MKTLEIFKNYWKNVRNISIKFFKYFGDTLKKKKNKILKNIEEPAEKLTQ